MRHAVAAFASLALTACGQGAQTAPSAAPSSEADGGQLALICEAFAHVSYEALASAYGAENLTEQTMPGPEGESYTATVLYPGDTARRLEIVWADAAKSAPASVGVSGEGSLWRGPHNIAIGDDLARVEAANGGPFRLWGFGWDYGGWVSNWNGGQLGDNGDCRVRARFNAEDAASAVSGDSEFMSDLAAMRAANPAVSEFGLMFMRPD